MKILFIHKSMNTGGIEESLKNLTNELVGDNDVNILLLNDTFGKENFNNKVKFLESKKMLRFLNPKKSYSKAKAKKLNILKKVITFSGIGYMMEKLFAKTHVVNDSYDVAVAFHGEDYITCYQAAKKVKADKKIVFLHFDTSRVNIKKRVYKLYKNFDKIICVSRACAEAFKKKYPELAEKVDFIYNICDVNEIVKKSEEFKISYPEEKLNIVSVSRLTKEKAHLRSLNIFKQLHDEGFKFCWHIIGDGETRGKIEKFIKSNNMSEYVKLYGNQQNPYPYIKAADLLYLGSYQESFGIVLIESMFLKIPALTTKTISSEEVISNYGIVCENDYEYILRSLKNILINRETLLKIKKNLNAYNLNKEEMIDKFKKF